MSAAFACKLWWQLRLDRSRWAEFMHVKYVRSGHLGKMQVSRPMGIWRRLERVRDFMESRIRWCLGKGFVDFWYDRWLLEVPLAEVLGRIDPLHILVAEFFEEGEWNTGLLQVWLPLGLVRQVQGITLYPDQEDEMVWLGSPTGLFSVKDGWEALRCRRNLSLVDGFIWNKILPLKISFLVWKVLRNLIPVEVNLQKRGIMMASRCSYCSLQEESLNHLFLGGPVAEQVWSFFQQRFGLLHPGSQSISAECLSWFASMSSVSANHIRTVTPCLIVWGIWQA
ncbi:uncharacterized protein [Coffea arabica]|uniref:Reverse transcriptase zinc-binding domain-containing protein n=1 Tax=Coffea arabica TaxID=13443 RepID=A0ABM4W8E5_COFAR